MSQTEPQSISHTEQVLDEIEAKLFSLPHDSRSNHAVLIDHYLKKWMKWNNFPPIESPFALRQNIPTIYVPERPPQNPISTVYA